VVVVLLLQVIQDSPEVLELKAEEEHKVMVKHLLEVLEALAVTFILQDLVVVELTVAVVVAAVQVEATQDLVMVQVVKVEADRGLLQIMII
jgi:hypothetical protein